MAKPLRLAPVNRLLDSQEPSVPNIVRTLRLWALFAAEALVADFFSLPDILTPLPDAPNLRVRHLGVEPPRKNKAAQSPAVTNNADPVPLAGFITGG